MRGRVAVVTGGTSGIGLEIVRGLALRGAHTVVVGRGKGRASSVAEAIRGRTGNSQVEGVEVRDLSLRAGWSTLADELLRRFPAIHVLVNNAGAYYVRREVTADGFERSFALNALAPLGLTTLLRDRLRASAPARVVNIASAAHEGYAVDFNDLQSADYHGFEAYARSKLELILLSRELARRFAGTGVTVNSLHPGLIRSGFASNNRETSARLLRLLIFLFGRGVRVGAETALRVAGDSDLEHVSGEYFSRGRVVTGSSASRDLSTARRLYEVCVPLIQVPEIPLPPELSEPTR
jgi:NAD(P)-dependent dehydrogenase (short-subunit alcohol dehydrogenase family)